MDEYIKRSDVLSLKHRLHNRSKDTIELYPVYVISPDAVENIPSADVAEVKNGKWLWDGYVYDAPFACSCCGKYMSYESNFCPHCGARMDGGT